LNPDAACCGAAAGSGGRGVAGCCAGAALIAARIVTIKTKILIVECVITVSVPSRKGYGKLAVCPVFSKNLIDGAKAN
jgi:hypothetical protein